MWTDWYWLIWLAPAFLIVEVLKAVDRQPGGTLSEWVWGVFAIDLKPRRFALLRRWTLAAFLTALEFHFFFRSSVVPVILFGALMAWWVYFWFSRERGRL